MTADTRASISDAPPPSPPPARQTGWVATLVTLLGAVVVLILIGQSALSGIAGYGAAEHATYQAEVDGVTALDIDSSAAEVTVRFDDVTEATLEVRSAGWRRNAGEWTLSNDNGVLRVSDDRRGWFWPSFGSSRTTADLVLPRSLEGTMSAQLQISSGSLRVDGDLTAVDISVSAGSLTFQGASTSLAADISAGEAIVTTSGPDTIDVTVSAGRFIGSIGGEQPTSTSVEVSAGQARIDLPDGDYALTGQVSAGDRTIGVRTDPASPHLLNVDVSAGEARIGYSG